MDRAGAERTDRQVGRLISIGGSILVAGQLPQVIAASADYAPWWNLGGVFLAAVVLSFALLGGVLPFRILRIGWIAVPVLGWVLWLATFLAFRGENPDTWLPWPWVLQPVIASFPVLWVRPVFAVVLTVASGCLPLASALLVLGSVPQTVAADTPLHATNIVFVAIFAGIRARLNRLREVERAAEEQDRRTLQAVAEARRQEQLARLIHDEVLSVLNAGMSFRGPVPGQLRAEAAHALTLIGDPLPGGDGGSWQSTRDALASVTASLGRIASQCPIDAEAVEGTVPAEVVEAVTAAAAEALRNSIRHAGASCSRSVRVRIAPGDVRIVVRDDGPGFDPDVVDPSRLGLRDSVHARMSALPGGAAHVRTAPGAGTEVVIAWSG